MKTILFALFLTGCIPQKPSCTQESLNALRTLYSYAARDVIQSGECDAVKRVEDCAAYRAIELHFEVAAHAMCGGDK